MNNRKYIKMIFFVLIGIICKNMAAQDILSEFEYKRKIEGGKYEYIDARGNSYILTNDSIFYQPVPMHLTSTGDTDNGKPAQKPISDENLLTSVVYIENIFANKEIHVEKRYKPTGVVISFKGAEVDKEVIIKSCNEMEVLELYLKSLL